MGANLDLSADSIEEMQLVMGGLDYPEDRVQNVSISIEIGDGDDPELPAADGGQSSGRPETPGRVQPDTYPHEALKTIFESDDERISSRQLAEATGWDNNRAASVLSKLHNSEALVEREKDEDNRQQYLYWLNDAGRHEVKRLRDEE